MKKVFSIILPLIALAVSINAQPPDGVTSKAKWQEFITEKENFKVMLPSLPRETVETVESEIGRVPIRSFVSQLNSNDFTVMVAEYPLSFDTDEAAKSVIEAGIGAMIAKMKLENTEQKDIVFDKYQGREVRAKIFTGVMTMRAYVVKNRMYILIAVVDNISLKSPISAEVTRFFDSFGFVKSPETIAISSAPVSGIEAQGNEPSSSFYAQPVSWRDFSQAGYGFTVRLPGEPHKETIKINPNDPRLDMYNWIAMGENGLVYQVAFQQLLAVPENDYNAKVYIESLRDGLAEGIGGKVVSERQVTLNGYAGREFKISSPKVNALGRLFLVGARVYIVNLLTGNGEVSQKAASDYFDSLKVTVTPNAVSTTAGTVVETAVWKEVAEPNLGFSVLMPAEPVREVKKVVDLTIELLTARGDGVFCLAGHMYLPGPKPSKQQLVQFFKNFGIGFATSMKANVVSEREISFEGYPGREFTMKNDLVTGLCRVYAVKDRSYILITMPTLANNADKAMAKFYGSFKLIEIKNDNPPPPPPPPMPKAEAAGKDALPVPKKINVSGGVLKDATLKKVQPEYPKEAKSLREQGAVQVQVLISEAGDVVEAIAISGPESLRKVSVTAAKQWKFKPTELSGVPVKVQGVLTFNFTLQ